jgi:hypothetical protein
MDLRRLGRANRRHLGVAMLAVAALVLTSCNFLGNPSNVWGNDLPDGCTSLTSTTGPCAGNPTQPGVWGAISGPFTRHQDGDPYATMCSGDTTTRSTCDPNWPTGGAPYTTATGVQNTTYHPGGYSWAIDVQQVGVPITVQIFDPAAGSTGAPMDEQVDATAGAFNTSYELFSTTANANDVEETPALSMNGQCTTGPGYQDFANGTGAAYSSDAWYTLCTFTPTQTGIYPLEVKTSDIPGVQDAGGGWNAYSVRAVADGPGAQPSVYPLTDVSMWIDASRTSSQFYLADVVTQDAGKTLLFDAYDPGDGTGPDAFTLQVLEPPSGLTTVPSGGTAVGCNYNATPSATPFPARPDVSSNCTITTKPANSSGGTYNGAWLAISVPIPANYTCTTDCWWSVRMSFGSGQSTPTDRTTWNLVIY